MFSRAEKQKIAAAVESVLREINHPEMPGPNEPVTFVLHVNGKEGWSWADIRPNDPNDTRTVDPNPWNEEARELLG